jgi:hypothetical protein
MTRAELQARLSAYLAAETKILEGQEYQIGDGVTARKLRRADLGAVQAEIRRLSAEIAALDRQAAAARSGRGTGAIRYARPAR